MTSKIIPIFILFIFSFTVAQKQEQTQNAKKTEVKIKPRNPKDTLQEYCERRVTVMDPKEKTLDKKVFIYTQPYYLRSHNSDTDYMSLQLVRRKGNEVIIYVKLFVFNACIKKDDVLEFSFINDSRYDLKNTFDINCDGNIVLQLNEKDIKNITKVLAKNFRLYSFQKDYVFQLTDEEAMNFKKDIECLHWYKFK